MEKRDSYFFRPRIGKNYWKGFRGYRTFVLGAYHFCREWHAMRYHCNHYEQCVREGRSREFNETCPIYLDRMDLYDGYYRISNSNIIEIDSYIEGERCPSYGEFTRRMTDKSGRLISSEDRENFWESVIFYNYIQHFLPEAEEFSYQDHKEELDADFPAFARVLDKLKPEIIYIWTDAIKDAVLNNRMSLAGIELVPCSREDVGSMSVWTITVKYAREGITSDVNSLLTEASVSWFKNMDKKTIIKEILTEISLYRRHDYNSGFVRHLPADISSAIQEKIQRLTYDDSAIISMTEVYQKLSELGDALASHKDSISLLTSQAKTVYSTFLYPGAIPVEGIQPEYLSLWKAGQSADLNRLDTTMTSDDILLAWVGDNEKMSLPVCHEIFEIMGKGRWKMALLMRTEDDMFYFKSFKESGYIESIYESQGFLLIIFSPDDNGSVMLYPDSIRKAYSQLTMLTPSKYRKKRATLTVFRKMLQKKYSIYNSSLLDKICLALYNAQDDNIIFVQNNSNGEDEIRCYDDENPKVIRLINDIRQYVAKYASNKNLLTYDKIQQMLNTDIKNIRKRISQIRCKRKGTGRHHR
ncbi:MAG: hypothetical protein IAB75_09865 [Bacteroidetes bacterium]|uniref:Uncharacterized protein n=1 Tax=Candidatus Cryptobacteroides avicola TaxID=2840757 RepID=A0A940DZY1_9BACT|nr:hypothetical protein [Candidatus Cryptobacteroides avicola]